MNPQQPDPPAAPARVPKRNNWLIASVALNLFLLGGIAAAVLIVPRHRPPMPAPGFGGPFGEGLSAAGREQVRAMREADEAALGEQLSALREARQAMDQAFVAEPFDRAAFDAAFARLRSAEAAMSGRMGERVAALAGVLSPADRKAFVRGLPRPPFGPGGPGGGGPRGPGGGLVGGPMGGPNGGMGGGMGGGPGGSPPPEPRGN